MPIYGIYMQRRIFHLTAMYLLVSVFAAAALLIDAWPAHPQSLVQWAPLFVITLPVTVLGDWLTDNGLRGLSHAALTRTRSLQPPWLRLGYLLALYMLFSICAVALFYWLESASI